MTTPREMGSLLDQIVRPTLNGGGPGLPVDVCRQILAVMRRQQVRDRLPLFLPAAVEVAHKTGSLSRVSNDAGILYAPRGQCVIAIFTKDLADDFKGRLAIGQAGRAVFEAFS
jgi:beta-lactamase class A